MRVPLRLVPALVVVLLILVRVFYPPFLTSTSFIPHVSWFWIIFVPLAYFGAWCLAPHALQMGMRLARRGLVPPIVFLALAVGALWALDVTWNHTIAELWTSAPHAHLVDSLTTAIFGGS